MQPVFPGASDDLPIAPVTPCPHQALRGWDSHKTHHPVPTPSTTRPRTERKGYWQGTIKRRHLGYWPWGDKHFESWAEFKMSLQQNLAHQIRANSVHSGPEQATCWGWGEDAKPKLFASEHRAESTSYRHLPLALSSSCPFKKAVAPQFKRRLHMRGMAETWHFDRVWKEVLAHFL